MLPLLAMLLFSLVGIGALVIDGGLALAEQSRLETSSEMVAWEWAHALSRPGDSPSIDCAGAGGGAPSTRCLRDAFVAPLLAPLGLDVGADADGGAWVARPRALDGSATDERGARLGALEDPDGLDATSGAPVRLSRTSPLLFGWGALAARSEVEHRVDLDVLQELRRQEGMTPTLDGRGLRGRGFQIEATARLIPAESGPAALRVGSLIPATPGASGDAIPFVPGLVGIAWELDRMDELVAALGAGGLELERVPGSGPGRNLAREGSPVACTFDPSGSGRSVGDALVLADATALALPVPDIPIAYLPVVVSCVDPLVVGFLRLGVSDDSTTLTLSRASDTAVAHRNASATPARPVPPGLAQVFSGGAHRQLVEHAAWLEHGLRVPRLAGPS